MPNAETLIGVPFDVELEALRSQDSSVEEVALQTADNLGRYYTEFIKAQSVLSYPIEERDGRFFAPSFGKFLMDTVSEQERNGATKWTLGRVEQFLVNAPVGSGAVFTSPPGWNGMLDSRGIPYGDYIFSQTFVYWKDSSGINFRNIVSGMDLKQNERLLESFDSPSFSEVEDERLRIEDVVRTPIFIENFQTEDVISRIEQSLGGNTLRSYNNSEGTKVNVSFDHLYAQLKEVEEGVVVDHEEIMRLINKFDNFIKNEWRDMSESEKLAAFKGELIKTILGMHAAARGKKLEETSDGYSEAVGFAREDSSSGPCPSVEGEVVINNGMGPRVVAEGELQKEKVKCIFCKNMVFPRIYQGRYYCATKQEGGCEKSVALAQKCA